MPIPYDVEIIGGIPVTGYVEFEGGRIARFSLPDGTWLEVGAMGGMSGPPHSAMVQLGNLILLEIHDSPAVMMAVNQSAPKVMPDSAPIRISSVVG